MHSSRGISTQESAVDTCTHKLRHQYSCKLLGDMGLQCPLDVVNLYKTADTKYNIRNASNRGVTEAEMQTNRKIQTERETDRQKSLTYA